MEYCPQCMRPVIAEYCSQCGCSVHEQNGAGMLPVGTKLTGSSGKQTYQLGKALGMGGFGITYIAVELETGHRLAIKEYFPSQCKWVQRGADGATVEAQPGKDSEYNRGRISFLKEARVLASLEEGNPAVVKGIDYLEMHNTAYLVMEYLEGKPLYKVVQERGRLAAGELLPKMDRLMAGISWLHGKGIIHRDICPDNIMWMADGSLKLMDFGSARMADGNSQFTVLYKPGYAPVEQYTSSDQGAWTDVYTLAATIYYCLTGKNPAVSTERMLRQETEGVDPLQPPDALDPQQRAALMHALGIKKEQRTQSMEQFRQELFPPVPTIPEPGPGVQKPIPELNPDSMPAISDWIRGHLIAVVSAAVAFVVLILIVIVLAI